MSAIAVVLAFVFAPSPATAQTVTTGGLRGTVVDEQGGVLPGVSVSAVHQPTGAVYETVSGDDGRYNILNARVGRYTITASLDGFKDEKAKNVEVALGETRAADFTMQPANVTEAVRVVAEPVLMDTTRAGAAANISNKVKETLPTITRSITDIVRINPMFNAQSGGAGDQAPVVSVAGSSFRYNSLQIDGAANNDLVGLAGPVGAPGGAAETQPISLDAVQEIQLVVSPYDVRHAGFAGGGINVITKTGSNDVHGTGFFFRRNQNWVGAGVDNRKVSTFKDKQGGGSLGGPIVRNTAFFFGALDYARQSRPSGVSINAGGQRFGHEAALDRYLADLKIHYGYTPGPDSKGEFIKATDSNKYLLRGDFNVAKNHQLTVRHNYVSALNDLGTPTLTTFRTPDQFYRYISDTNSTVGQLNSNFTNAVNELRLTYMRVRDHRGHAFDQPPFPQVTVTIAPGVNVISGTEQFSARSAIDQDIVELDEACTLLRGRHMITIGSHNEFLKLRNLFIRDNFGTYSFATLALFEQGVAQSFDYSFSATSDPLQAARFKVYQLGFSAGDLWRARPDVTVTYGLRVDAPRYRDHPSANPTSLARFGYATDVVPNGVEWSPRVGINWDVRGDSREQVRGGVGLFTGRPAYVWISNQYANTGIDFTRIGGPFNTANRIPFITDPFNQPMTVTGAAAGTFSNEIDLIDPNFKYPSIARGNVAWDRRLPRGVIATAELVWSKTVKDIRYENLNYAPLGNVIGVGGRPFFGRLFSSLSDVLLLENTSRGYSWTIRYEVRKPFTKGVFVDASYAYGRAKTIMDGTFDQAAANWGNVYVPGDPNDPPLATSNFDPGHRINIAAAYDVRLAHGFAATLSGFYSGQTGRPYTLTTNRDVNGDSRGTNDLLYIPASASELTFAGGSYQDFIGFINADACLTHYIGRIIPRNACRAPWTNTLDARTSVRLPYRNVEAEITLDVLNLINLLNSRKGLVEYMSFGQLAAFQPIPTTVTPSAPLTGYNISALTAPTFRKFLRDDLRSRWQAQLGLRLRF